MAWPGLQHHTQRTNKPPASRAKLSSSWSQPSPWSKGKKAASDLCFLEKTASSTVTDIALYQMAPCAEQHKERKKQDFYSLSYNIQLSQGLNYWNHCSMAADKLRSESKEACQTRFNWSCLGAWQDSGNLWHTLTCTSLIRSLLPADGGTVRGNSQWHFRESSPKEYSVVQCLQLSLPSPPIITTFLGSWLPRRLKLPHAYPVTSLWTYFFQWSFPLTPEGFAYYWRVRNTPWT